MAQAMAMVNQQAEHLKPTTEADSTPVNKLNCHFTCPRCGKAGHMPQMCYFRNQTCHNTGHIAKCCPEKKTERQQISEPGDP